MKLNRLESSTHQASGERQPGAAAVSGSRVRAVEALKSVENDPRQTSGDESAKLPMADPSEQSDALLNAQHLAEQLSSLGKAADALIHVEALHSPTLHVLDDSA